MFGRNALGFANDLSAVCILVDYWPNSIPTAALMYVHIHESYPTKEGSLTLHALEKNSAIFYAAALVVAFIPVRFFGEVEFVVSFFLNAQCARIRNPPG